MGYVLCLVHHMGYIDILTSFRIQVLALVLMYLHSVSYSRLQVYEVHLTNNL